MVRQPRRAPLDANVGHESYGNRRTYNTSHKQTIAMPTVAYPSTHTSDNHVDFIVARATHLHARATFFFDKDARATSSRVLVLLQAA
jgi:hypothetical protein